MRPGEQIREYILEAKIGEGGMAEVWLARHVHLEKAVALKVMSASLMGGDFSDRFLKEARAMARLQHPNILSASEFFVEAGTYFLVMPHIDAGSLEDQILAARGPLPLDFAVGVSYQILGALDFAHQNGVIHRDVKPSNILLDSEGRAYLADFGIALMVGEDRKTRTGTSIGTPHYMSPEQIMRPKTMDHRADVYSYGCVLYEMLCGRPPFDAPEDEGDTDFVVKSGHLQEEVPSPRSFNPSLPVAMEEILLKVLEKDPDRRYQGCGEFARALQGFQERFSSPAASRSGRSHTVIEENDPFQAHYPAPSAVTVPPQPPPTPPVSVPVVAPAGRPAKKGGGRLLIALTAVMVILALAGGWYWISQAPMREFDRAIARNNLVSGPANAYDTYQKVLADSGPDSKMVKEMNARAEPLLKKRRQEVLDEWYRESDLGDSTWEDHAKNCEWLQKIAPCPENTAHLEYARGNINIGKRNYREALVHFQSALSGKPDWVLAINGEGRASRGLEDKAAAYQFYQQAYGIDPNWHFCVINLADIVNDYAKDLPKAEALYNQALSLAPDRPTFHWRVANFYFNQGKAFYPRAYEEYQKSLSLPGTGSRGLSPQAENLARARMAKLSGSVTGSN